MATTTATLLPPARAAALRRVLVALAAVAGAAAGLLVLGSQATADFLREGPARLLAADGDVLRFTLGLGCIAGTALASVALWARTSAARLALAGVGLVAALGLVHILAAPAAALLAGALAAEGAGRLTRARLAEVGPRRYPLPWAAGAVLLAVGLVASSAATVYLARPLFDEGERLEQALDFQVAGLVQPTAVSGGSAPTAAGSAATPAPAEAQQGELVSRGELEGADAFHTASGEVLLVRAPDGAVVLRFQDYEVRNGPDLFVYLTPDPGGDVHVDGAIELSAVRATSGFVNYEVPAGVDPASFGAVVIYCKAFSVTFATAALR